MAVKTITVTEDAYTALSYMKEPHESFSDVILRVSRRKPLSDFFGVLSAESGERLEEAIYSARKKRNKTHKLRIRRVVQEMRN